MVTRLIIAEDFNGILDRTLDTSNPARLPDPELGQWASALHLTEVWRWKNPQMQRYSHLSAVHRLGSRNDLAFCSSATLPYVASATYLPAWISDHSPLEVVLQLGEGEHRGCWQLATRWLGDEKVEENMQGKIAQYWDCNDNVTNAQVTWDAFKATIRGDYISAIKAARLDYVSEIKELESRVSTAEEVFASDSSTGAYSSLAQARRALSLHLSGSTASSERLLRARIFESGDKNRRLLASLVADPKFQTVVPTIHTNT